MKITGLYNQIYNYLLYRNIRRRARNMAIKTGQYVGVMPINGKLSLVHSRGLDRLNRDRKKQGLKKVKFLDLKKACYFGFYADGREV